MVTNGVLTATRFSVNSQNIRRAQSTQMSSLSGLSKGDSLFGQALPRRGKRASATGLSTTALEQSVFQKINQYRKQKGLAALTLNVTITQQARQHSQNMARSRSMTHNGFESRASVIRKTIPYRAAAENVAYNMGYGNPDTQAIDGWLKSAGHLRNIQGNYNLTGIGVAKNAQNEYFFTQIFIKR
jgi:uncharacterized protein YkwD